MCVPRFGRNSTSSPLAAFACSSVPLSDCRSVYQPVAPRSITSAVACELQSWTKAVGGSNRAFRHRVGFASGDMTVFLVKGLDKKKYVQSIYSMNNLLPWSCCRPPHHRASTNVSNLFKYKLMMSTGVQFFTQPTACGCINSLLEKGTGRKKEQGDASPGRHW
ncbi:hypothetical protein EDB92DRAFT_1070114 [Lactarius akahatsu]|uniref:Uncharacterized protein n=1 Tax=Lactarius akahatsu TaxID=416441 RepID=A0AAD4LBS4_9AGAM|nr:hypothetical protein EDB92DRAFT_1070114 [Lactarius akahatsu]